MPWLSSPIVCLLESVLSGSPLVLAPFSDEVCNDAIPESPPAMETCDGDFCLVDFLDVVITVLVVVVSLFDFCFVTVWPFTLASPWPWPSAATSTLFGLAEGPWWEEPGMADCAGPCDWLVGDLLLPLTGGSLSFFPEPDKPGKPRVYHHGHTNVGLFRHKSPTQYFLTVTVDVQWCSIRLNLTINFNLGVNVFGLWKHNPDMITWSRRVMWHQRPLVAMPWRRQRDSAENSGTFPP